MRKSLMFLVLCLASIGIASASPNIAWLCDLEGELNGKSVGMGPSYSKLAGGAVLTCFSLLGGEVVSKNVDISIKSFGVGLGYSEVKSVKVIAYGMGFDDVDEFSEHYRISANVTVDFIGVGVEPSFGFYVGDQGIGFNLQLQGRDVMGMGAHLRGSIMSVKNAM